jgi:hypothetical protein
LAKANYQPNENLEKINQNPIKINQIKNNRSFKRSNNQPIKLKIKQTNKQT